MSSEDIEPTSHMISRNMIAQAMELRGYEVIAGYYINLKWTTGNPNRHVIPPETKDEYYHEVDLMCRKRFDNGLIEELFIDIGSEDDWDTRHSFANSSKYVYKKQMGNDELFEQWLHMVKPDAIFIRPSKGEIISMGLDHILLFNHVMNLKRKYIEDFIATANIRKPPNKQIEKTSTKF